MKKELNKIYQHNVLQIPWPVDDNSVHSIVTSPPYLGLVGRTTHNIDENRTA